RAGTRRRQDRAGVDGWRGPRQLVVQRDTKGLTRPLDQGDVVDAEQLRFWMVDGGKRPKVPQGPQRRVLHDIFRIVQVSHEPSRQPVRRIEMWKYDLEAVPRRRRRTLRLSVDHALHGSPQWPSAAASRTANRSSG